MSSIEHKQLQAAADDGTKARAWHARWEAEFRHSRWVELNGAFWPRPGQEPQGFSFGDRCARDNALDIEAKRKLVGLR